MGDYEDEIARIRARRASRAPAVDPTIARRAYLVRQVAAPALRSRTDQLEFDRLPPMSRAFIRDHEACINAQAWGEALAGFGGDERALITAAAGVLADLGMLPGEPQLPKRRRRA